MVLATGKPQGKKVWRMLDYSQAKEMVDREMIWGRTLVEDWRAGGTRFKKAGREGATEV